MIRVLQVMEATIGGTRKHLGQLARGLDPDQFEVVVACSALRDPDFRGDMEELRTRGVEVVEIPMQRNIDPRSDAKACSELRRLMRGRRFHVVHTHSSKAGVLGRVAALSAGTKKLVHTPHSFAFLHNAEFSARKRRAFLEIERFLGRFTSSLVAVSEAEKTAAVDHGVVDASNVRVITNGIEPDLEKSLRPAIDKELENLDPEQPLIGVVGLLEPAKGQGHLIDALELLRDEFPGLRCLLVGDGSLRPHLEAQVKVKGLESVVRFVGQRDRAVDLIARLDLLVIPSLWEGLPYVLLEAMSLSKPVVAAAVGGCGEVVVDGETGRLVPSRDSQALAQAIAALLRDPAGAEQMGRRGRERVLERFPLDRMIRSHEDVYRRVVSGKVAG